MAAPLTLLFDLDGTLVDTDHLHLGAYDVLLAAGASAVIGDFTDPALWAYMETQLS